MANKTKLTSAVLIAMGAAGTVAANTSVLELDRSLDLPLPGTTEFEAAATLQPAEMLLAQSAPKKKAKKKGIKCLNPGGHLVIMPVIPQFKGCPPGLSKKRKKKA